MRNVRLPASGPKKWAKNKRQGLVRPGERSSLPPGAIFCPRLLSKFLLSYRRSMLLARSNIQPYWRTLLILGRASNVPTVWSNCLAGWLLGGGGSIGRFQPARQFDQTVGT